VRVNESGSTAEGIGVEEGLLEPGMGRLHPAISKSSRSSRNNPAVNDIRTLSIHPPSFDYSRTKSRIAAVGTFIKDVEIII
jgi:hypothetical protein